MTFELVVGRRVVATAPVRVADVGGWTDTWFGSPGQVCSVAVGPGVAAAAELVLRADGELPVRIVAPAIALDGTIGPSPDQGWAEPTLADHPLLAHAVAAVLERVDLPPDLGVDVTLTSAVPPGASLGTSGAIVVALLAALQSLLLGPDERPWPEPADLARAAHEVETGRAGREAGLQDQFAAAVGGCTRMIITTYPQVRWQSIFPEVRTTQALAERLVTVVFGPHDSSLVHGEVIRAMTTCSGAEHDTARAALRELSRLAGCAAEALRRGDLEEWGTILTAATDAQAQLNPGLVGTPHRAAIEVARRCGAAGWKVNGAGGDGGSLTIVAGTAPGAARASEIADALHLADPSWTVVPLRPATQGVHVER